MSSPHETRPPLAERLHPIFDQQVTNYGAYNLVFATGRAEALSAEAPQELLAARSFLLGYRRAPSELVIAALDPLRMQPLGVPVPIDSTNAVRLMRERNRILAETTSGLRFIVALNPVMTIETAQGIERLDQEADLEDFLGFVETAEQL